MVSTNGQGARLSLSLTVGVQDVPPRLAQLLALQVQLAPDGVLGFQHVGVQEGGVEDLRGEREDERGWWWVSVL